MLPLGEFAHRPLFVETEELRELFIALHVKAWVLTLDKAGHVEDAGLGIKENVVGDIGDLCFDRRGFINRLSVNKQFSHVLPVDTHQMTDERGLSSTVRPNKTVYRALRRRQRETVKSMKAVKALDEPLSFNHGHFPPS